LIFILKNMSKIIINYLGVSIGVSSGNERFLRYALKYFNGSRDFVDINLDAVIDVVFEKGYIFKPEIGKAVESEIIFGENVGCDREEGLSFKFHELFVKFDFSQKTWKVSCSFEKIFLKHLANVLFFKGWGVEEYYFRVICRMVIQNILFMKLRLIQRCCLISAAAIAIDGKAFVFAGYPGSGKTTIIGTLKEMFPSSIVLAENYVIIKDGLVHCFTEGKNEEFDLSFPVSKIFIISRSKRISVRKISRDYFLSMLRSINQYTAELPEHSPFVGATLINESFASVFFEDGFDKLPFDVDINYLVADDGLVEFKNLFLNYFVIYDK